MDETLIQTIEAQNAILSEILSSLPSQEYYDTSFNTSILLQDYLNAQAAGIQTETPASGETQLSDIYELLVSMDGKMTPDEVKLLTDETYLTQSKELAKTLTAIQEKADLTETHLQNLENIQIPMLCGIAMIFGAICTVILSRFLHH